MGDYADESKRTLWCGNLHDKVTEELLYELFIQAGPLERVKLVSKGGNNFSFIVYRHECSVPYSLQLMKDVELFKRRLKLQFRTRPDAGSDSSSPFHRSMSEPTIQNQSPGRDYWASPMQDGSSNRSKERRSRFDQGNESLFDSPSYNDSDQRRGRDRSRGNRDDRGNRSNRDDRGNHGNHSNQDDYRQRAVDMENRIQQQLNNERAINMQWQYQQMAMQMSPGMPWQQQQHQPQGRRW